MFEFEDYKIQEEKMGKTESFQDMRLFVIGFSVFICTVMSTFILGTLFNETIHGRFSNPSRDEKDLKPSGQSPKTSLKIVEIGDSNEELMEATEQEEKEDKLRDEVGEPKEEPVSEEGDAPAEDQASLKLELDQTTTQCDEATATNAESQGTSDASSTCSQIHAPEAINK